MRSFQLTEVRPQPENHPSGLSPLSAPNRCSSSRHRDLHLHDLSTNHLVHPRRHPLPSRVNMDFSPLISDRSVGMLRKIGHCIITWVDGLTSSSIFQARAPLLPLFSVPTSDPTASAAPSVVVTAPFADERQQHQHNNISATNILQPVFPLTQLPKDACQNVLSLIRGRALQYSGRQSALLADCRLSRRCFVGHPLPA